MLVPPSRDDFARWRDDSVTRYVMAAFATMADANKAEWTRISWDNGVANEAALRELKTRADTYLAMRDAPYEAFCETNGDEPRDE